MRRIAVALTLRSATVSAQARSAGDPTALRSIAGEAALITAWLRRQKALLECL
ncbi:hypothetical protein BY998_10593 [Methylobacterium sp. B4]|nr:hypothetical protein BY998_10593 [Methylobacterium sp. B4]